MKVTAVVPAAGAGKRMGQGQEKLFLLLGDRPILAHTLGILNKSTGIDEIVVVAAESNLSRVREEVVKKYSIEKVTKIVVGGSTRRDSVYEGLKEVKVRTELVLIHDGDRPFLTEGLISKSIEAAEEFGAVILAIPASSTIKEVEEDLFVKSTPLRRGLWEVQTPQVFKRYLIITSYEKAIREDVEATDDSALVERSGCKVKVTMGSFHNIKITTPEDLIIAETIFRFQKTETKLGRH